MSLNKKKRLLPLAGTLALAAALGACGGGGGGDGDAPAKAGTAGAVAEAPATGKRNVESPMAVACNGCAAVDPTTYAGSGTGVWKATNTGSAEADFPVYIFGLAGQDVTLVLTNETDAAMPMPSLRLNAMPPRAQLSKSQAGPGEGDAAAARMRAGISEFNRAGFARLLGGRKGDGMLAQKVAPTAPLAAAGPSYAVGDHRSIRLADGSRRLVEVAGQKVTGDGTLVNIWVETSELGDARVSPALVTRVRDAFAGSHGIYDMLVQVGGPLWGPHGEQALIAATAQPLDIFFVNLDNNGQPYGTLGYFYSLNNFTVDVAPQSNASLGVYMDSETLYLDAERGVRHVVSALAHEGMHMQNFYRRNVSMGAQFAYDVWLEEMSAMMMEDWAGHALDPGFNAIRDSRLPDYLGYQGAGSYNCSLTNWTPMGAGCDSYAVNGSFGGYLDRQFGLAFFQSLLRSQASEDSRQLLDTVIQAQRPGSSLGQEVRRFGVAAAGLVPLGAGLADYSMPGRSEAGFTLVPIDPGSMSAYARALPAAVPSQLQPLASFPVARLAVRGALDETVRVPAGASLTVVVH